MTPAAYAAAAVIPSVEVDCGPRPSMRGQGKRIGGGMIAGSMSAAMSLPSGIQRRPDYEHAAGVTPELWRELSLLLALDHDEQVRAAIGALQAGVPADEAMAFAYDIALPPPASGAEGWPS